MDRVEKSKEKYKKLFRNEYQPYTLPILIFKTSLAASYLGKFLIMEIWMTGNAS